MEFDGESRKRPLSQKDPNGIHLIEPLKMTPLYHIKKAEGAISTLKTVVHESDWRKILDHSSGIAIYMKLDSSENGNIPLIKGELNIQGFTPEEIFSVIELRDIWDDWYEKGYTIEKLSETISLTYTIMKGPFKSKDLSLIEKFELSNRSGTIYYASTSVETLKAPFLNEESREKLKLSGWILKPISDSPPCTKVTYVIQMNGLLPFDTSKTYLARRPLVINTISKHLQNNKQIVAQPILKLPPRGSSLQQSNQISNFNGNDASKNGSNIRQSRLSSLGDINEHEEENTELKIPDFPMPPEKSIVPKHSLEKSIVPRHSLEKSIVPRHSIEKSIVPRHSIEKSIVPEPSLEKSIVPKPSFEEPIIPKRESQGPSELIKKPVKSHKHYNAAQKALKLFKLLANDWDGWNFYAESKGVKIYQMYTGKPMPYLRGDATIYGEFHPADILSYITNLDSRKIWDDRYEEGSVLERYGPDDVITRVALKGTFPISGRDLTTIGTIERDPDTGTIWVADTSVVDSRFPEDSKYVRANLLVAGWEFRPKFDDGKIISVDVKYIVDIDLKLNSVPQSILKMVSMQTPLCVAKIDYTLQRIGFPPYILKTTGLIKNTEFDIKTFQYEVTITSIDGGTITELRTSKKMYPNGVDISVQPENVKVESLLNSNENVRITVPNGTETLHITITKNTEGTQNTFKGEKIGLSKEIVPILILPLENSNSHEKGNLNRSKAGQTNHRSFVLNNGLKNQVNDQNKSRQDNHEEVFLDQNKSQQNNYQEDQNNSQQNSHEEDQNNSQQNNHEEDQNKSQQNNHEEVFLDQNKLQQNNHEEVFLDQNKSQQNNEEATIPVPVQTKRYIPPPPETTKTELTKNRYIPPPPKYSPATSKTELTKKQTKTNRYIPPPPEYLPATSKTELTKNSTKSSNTPIIGFNTREIIVIFSLMLCAFYSGRLSALQT